MRPLALITGGTSGIGLGVAKALIASHDLALVFARDEERARMVGQELRRDNGEAKVHTFLAPLIHEADCVTLLAAVTAEFKTEPDVLVNCAGRLRDGLFLSVEFSQHERMVLEHLVVPMALSRLCLKKMYRVKSGRIINLSSITSRRAKRGQVNYTTVKAGIEGFTRALALEVAHRGITVNAIAPGLIQTPMTKVLIETLQEKLGDLRSVVPAGFAGQPDDIGTLVAYLCSEQGRYITGQTIDVDGGRGLGGDLVEKIALVTGGTRGIGRAITLKLARSGYKVLALYGHNRKAADETMALASREDLRVLCLRGDLTKDVSFDEVLEKIKAEAPHIDCLVHSAASGVHRQAMDLTLKHLRFTFEINVFSIHRLVSQLIERMPAGSSLVGITSSGGTRVIPYYAAIGSSKAALESLFRHYASELSPRGVAVNLVCPGLVLTEAVDAFVDGDERVATTLEKTPTGKLTTVDDVADVVHYLVSSPATGQMQGQTLVIDGGRSL